MNAAGRRIAISPPPRSMPVAETIHHNSQSRLSSCASSRFTLERMLPDWASSLGWAIRRDSIEEPRRWLFGSGEGGCARLCFSWNKVMNSSDRAAFWGALRISSSRWLISLCRSCNWISFDGPDSSVPGLELVQTKLRHSIASRYPARNVTKVTAKIQETPRCNTISSRNHSKQQKPPALSDRGFGGLIDSRESFTGTAWCKHLPEAQALHIAEQRGSRWQTSRDGEVRVENVVSRRDPIYGAAALEDARVVG